MTSLFQSTVNLCIKNPGGHVSSSESSESDEEAPPIRSQRIHMQDLGINDYHDKDGECGTVTHQLKDGEVQPMCFA